MVENLGFGKTVLAPNSIRFCLFICKIIKKNSELHGGFTLMAYNPENTVADINVDVVERQPHHVTFGSPTLSAF